MMSLEKNQLYQKAYNENQINSLFNGLDSATIKKLVLYGVKAVNTSPMPNMDDTVEELEFMDKIQYYMGLLTPSEFVNLFPITKDYDGDKYELKDYFYTRDYIATLPDEPIGDVDKVSEFLFEYHNREISKFAVKFLCVASQLQRLNGQPSIAELFAEKNGIETRETFTDEQGRKFWISRKSGNWQAIGEWSMDQS